MSALLDNHVKDWLKLTKGFGYEICAYKRVELSPDRKIMVLYPFVEQIVWRILSEAPYMNVERFFHVKDEDIAPDYIRLVTI